MYEHREAEELRDASSTEKPTKNDKSQVADNDMLAML